MAQDKEKDCLETIKTVLDSENSRLIAKMEISDFQHLIDSGFSTAVEEKERLPEQQYSATYKVIGSVEQLRSVSAFLREHGITYTVLDQRTI